MHSNTKTVSAVPRYHQIWHSVSLLTHCASSRPLMAVCMCVCILESVYGPALFLTSIHTVESITANCCCVDSGMSVLLAWMAGGGRWRSCACGQASLTQDEQVGEMEPSNTDIFGPLKCVLIRGCPHFRGWIPYSGKYLWGPNFVLFDLGLSEWKI